MGMFSQVMSFSLTHTLSSWLRIASMRLLESISREQRVTSSLKVPMPQLKVLMETRVVNQQLSVGSTSSLITGSQKLDLDPRRTTWFTLKTMKKVIKYLEENDRASEVATFKTNINKVMTGLLGKFKDLQFFTGESMDAEAMILMLDYREVDGEEKPILIAFKHGISEEKY